MLFFGAGRGAGHAFESPWRQLRQKQEALVAARAAGGCGARVVVEAPCTIARAVRWSPFASTAHRSRTRGARRPPSLRENAFPHAGSAASADAARAAAQEAGKALSANPRKLQGGCRCFRQVLGDAAAGLADASKLIGKNTGEAIKASSKAIDSVSSSVKAMGPLSTRPRRPSAKAPTSSWRRPRISAGRSRRRPVSCQKL